MKVFPVETESGVLRLPPTWELPPKTPLAVLALEAGEAERDLATLADASGAFAFLRDEPDFYSDADLLSEHRNPRFSVQR